MEINNIDKKLEARIERLERMNLQRNLMQLSNER